ncbi:choline dehydrogenase-like flavoprotein [Bradyrhizobium japonicum]
MKDKIGTLEARKHERLLKAVQQRLDANTEAMRQHRDTVEHPFGTIRLAWERRNS